MRSRGQRFITDHVYSRRSPDILGILDRVGAFTCSPAHQIYLILNFNVIADFTATDPTLAITPDVSNYIKIEWNRSRFTSLSEVKCIKQTEDSEEPVGLRLIGALGRKSRCRPPRKVWRDISPKLTRVRPNADVCRRQNAPGR
jgi:hypothetical protein